MSKYRILRVSAEQIKEWLRNNVAPFLHHTGSNIPNFGVKYNGENLRIKLFGFSINFSGHPIELNALKMVVSDNAERPAEFPGDFIRIEFTDDDIAAYNPTRTYRDLGMTMDQWVQENKSTEGYYIVCAKENTIPFVSDANEVCGGLNAVDDPRPIIDSWLGQATCSDLFCSGGRFPRAEGIYGDLNYSEYTYNGKKAFIFRSIPASPGWGEVTPHPGHCGNVTLYDLTDRFPGCNGPTATSGTDLALDNYSNFQHFSVCVRVWDESVPMCVCVCVCVCVCICLQPQKVLTFF
jgi:hypothetical protein